MSSGSTDGIRPGRVQRMFIFVQGWLLRRRYFTSKVLPNMPRQLRWALRRAYFAPVDLIEWVQGDRNPMVPRYSERFTGYSGYDFVRSGQELVDVLAEAAGLDKHSKLLDIGSGIGRLAIPLTKLIDPPGSYDGLDVVERGVRWCATRITARYPHFQFTHANIFNAEYNPGGTVKAEEYDLPYDDASFDVVWLFSVFTHMLAADVAHYMEEISRVLRPGGRLAATFLVINEASAKSMQSGLGWYNFTYHEGPQWQLREGMDVPELGIAYDESYVRDLYTRNGLTVSELYAGTWSGQPAESGVLALGQDLVIGIKG
jgi:ubiquinone/menaquinone biosynthesis C-methylase UbiE